MIPTGPPPPLPPAPGRLLAALLRHSALALILATVVSALSYLVNALIPLALGHALDAGLERGLTAELLQWALILGGLAAASAVVSWLHEAAGLSCWAAGMIPASRAAAHRTGRNGRAISRQIAGGEVVTATATDPDYLGAMMYFVVNVIGAVVSVAVVAVLMLRVSVPLGLLVLIGLPVVLMIIAALVKPLQSRQAVQREAQGRLATITTDAVVGLRVLRGIGGEDVYAHRYAEQSAIVRDAGIKVASTQALLSSLKAGLPGVFSVVVVAAAAGRVLDGTLSPGQLVTFYGYTSFLVAPLGVAADLITVATRSWVGARKVSRILGIEPLTDDGAVDPAAAPDPSGDLLDATTGVRLKGRRTTAVVCAEPATGAALAERLGRADDAAGAVSLGGVDLRALPVEWVRRTILVAGAQAEVFAGSLAEAVLGEQAPLAPARDMAAIVADQARRDAEGDEAPAAGSGGLVLSAAQRSRAMASLEVAAADDVVDSVGGLLGTITEKGRSLSGGQRQRLAAARAVAAEAPVLVLIEPTSAVDSHTEARIAQRLVAHRRGRTTVVVTASPLVLNRCQEVVLLDPGSGAEMARGTHRELSATCPAYAAVVHRFQGGEAAPAGPVGLAAPAGPVGLAAPAAPAEEEDGS